MNPAQATLVGILLSAVVLFVWGRWRHDIVALLALLACVSAGLVPAAEAFDGFGHPAVITVACVLVMSYGLRTSGVVDLLARRLLPTGAGPLLSMALLTGLGAALSAFMNNVGALALLMPIAISQARRHDLPPGRVLMPLAFGTILGGMTTLIGTPPNLIVSGFRADAGARHFAMFDFAPVGLAVALAGLAFILLLGWRLVPERRKVDAEAFDTGRYLTEVRVPSGSRAVGMSLHQLEEEIDDDDAQIVGMIRGETRLTPPNPGRWVHQDDILVIEAEPEAIGGLLSALELTLEEDVKEPVEAGGDRTADEQDDGEDAVAGDAEESEDDAASDEAETEGGDEEDEAEEEGGDEEEEGDREEDDVAIQEFVVMPQASVGGRSATDLQLRVRHGINLLAISRRGQRSIRRLRSARLQAGDVLLLQGHRTALAAFAGEAGIVPLAERDISVPDTRRAWVSGLGMAAAVVIAATGLAPAAVAFMAGVVAFMLLRVVPLREVYRSVDWPVVVLLAALLPVAGAMTTSGTADLLARGLLEGVVGGRPVFALVVILVVTMVLSDFMNNAATVAVMCPIALGAAAQLGANPDGFLMAVAVGGSCAFLTPIGHQNNTLILGPGGFRFGDYWRLGLPLELLVVLVGVPALLWAWPL